MNTTHDEVVVTGAGLVSCLGLSAEETWRRVRAGECGLGDVPALESRTDPDRGGGQAPDIPPGILPDAPREARFLRTAVEEALHRARGEDPIRGRVGAVLGTTLHGMRRAGEFLRSSDPSPLRDFLAAPVLVRALEGLRIGGRPFDGPVLTTCAACSSGLSSVGLALTLLRAGELDAVIAGGYDPVSEYAFAGFESLRVVAAGPVRPFCRGREGMKVAEGYGILVLERAADARARGAQPLASILGYGESSDAHHLTLPHPEGDGAARAVALALSRAGADQAEVGLIAAHATSTPNNDAAEFAALARAFGDRLAGVPAVAFKSHLGHTLGGAGAVELILSILAMRDGVAPPTANIAADDLEYPINLAAVARAAPIRVTLNTSLGFGGANTAVVAAPPGRTQPAMPPRPREVAITGIGVILPGAVGNDAFAARLRKPREGLRPGEWGGIDEAQIEHLFASRRVRRMSDYVKLTLAATALALRDAGVEHDAAFAQSCSAILGTTHGSAGFSSAYYAQIVREGPGAANPVLFAEGVPNAGSAQLSLMLGVRGGCQTIIGARTAGLDALRLAALRIASGEWDRAIVGAAEEHCDLVDSAYAHCGLRNRGEWALPFGRASGFVSGAGAVAMILESRRGAEARARQARAVVVRGAGASIPAGAGRSAEPHASVLAALARDSSPAPLISSANATWIDAVESAAALAAGTKRTASLSGFIPETFSVGPLAAVAALCLTGDCPRLGAAPSSTADSAPSAALWDILCTDYAGPIAGMRLGLAV